jgi:hypothetical protein
MSTTTAETLRASSTDELNEKLREAKEELFPSSNWPIRKPWSINCRA